MFLIYSLVIVTLITLTFTNSIQKHVKKFYMGAIIIACLVTSYEIFRLINDIKLGGIIGSLEIAFIKGNVSISLFILVMFAGALNKKWNITKKLLRIRAANAILGSILIIPHCVMYIVRFIKKLTEGKPITSFYIVYLLVGIVAFIIMIPLFITSFKKIRAKMKYDNWKKIQRWAYLFYFMSYIHIVLVLLNNKVDLIKLITYTIIFVGYFIFKVINKKDNILNSNN